MPKPCPSLTSTLLAAMGTLAPGALGQANPGVPYRFSDFPLTVPAASPRLLVDVGLMASLGDRAVFVGDGLREVGRELWVSDGTSAGTSLLADLDPRVGRDLALESTLVFTADGVRHAAFLGKDEVSFVLVTTDGTSAGTRTARLVPAGFGTLAGAVGDRVLVSLTTVAGPELWTVRDGAAERIGGPWPVDGFFDLACSTPSAIYFWNDYAGGPSPLWRTDGTPGGTVPISGFPRNDPQVPLTASGDRVFTYHRTASLARSPGVIEPSEASVRDIAFPEGGTLLFNTEIVPVPGGALYGVADALVFTDGANASLFLEGVSAKTTGATEQDHLPVVLQTVAGPVTLFAGTQTATGRELWATDGTPAGTRMLADISAGTGNSTVKTLTLWGGRYVFSANGRGPWVTDGTPAGTVAWETAPSWMPTGTRLPGPFAAAAGNRLLLRPNSGPSDPGLVWSYDGPGSRTTIESGPGVARPEGTRTRGFSRAGDAVLFQADRIANSFLLYRTGGTAATTGPLTPEVHFNASALRSIGPLAWFMRQETSGSGYGVWRTDGTPEGTFATGIIPPNATGYRDITPGGDGVLITATGVSTSGTGAGSLRSITAQGNAGYAASDAQGRTYYHFQSSGFPYYGLGPAGQMTLLARLTAGASTDPLFTPFAGRMYFRPGGSGTLWRSDWSPAGTAAIPGATEVIRRPAIAGDHLIFARQPAGADPVLVALDAAENLVQLRAFRSIDDLCTFGDHALILADDGEHGVEPWITDGTPAGTRLLVETVPGPRGAAGQEYYRTGGVSLSERLPLLWPDGDRCYFAVTDDTLADHAWVTDGTAEGTRRLGALPDDPRRLPLRPTGFAASGGVVYFRGWTADRGNDLYAVRLCDADFTGDGFVDFFDYLDYLTAFEAGTPDADFNGDGFLDFFDYDAFVGAFERGC